MFDKTADIGRGGTVLDRSLTKNAWEDKSVRQRPILDELMDFATWYEAALEKSYEEKKTPLGEREDVGLVKMLTEAKAKDKAADEASGIKCLNLSEQKLIYQKKIEFERFPFANLMEKQPSAWTQLQTFYGINEDFPIDNLYYKHETVKQNVVLLNPGLHSLMHATKKYKLEVVNLGLKMF